MDDSTKVAVRRNYDAIGNDPENWVFVADSLFKAAEILYEATPASVDETSTQAGVEACARLPAPTLMLRGFAFECLLKGFYVAEGNALAADGRYTSPGGRDHDLPGLARRTSLSLTTEEERLLRYIGDFITQGRYPIARRAPEAFSAQPDGSRRECLWSADDESAYRRLRRRIRNEAIHARDHWVQAEHRRTRR